MTLYDHYANVVQRVVDKTGILRTRTADVQRIERNGIPAEGVARIEAEIQRLERVVRDLEKAVA